tara:strand:+ start:1054 stop:1446 length:393 start_codon:yes stop_codon:yes gene_type:complete
MVARFPNIKPSSRTYKPGKYPQTIFEGINGSTTVIRYGSQCYNSELTLQFTNIEDSWADQIIEVFENANGKWDYVVFNAGPLDCAGTDMQNRMREGSPLKWRFAEPPQVTYKFKNICDVSCSFIGYLDGY